MTTSWDNVPWMMGGGVEHSVETARMLAYAAFGGQEGIVGGKDLEVTANTVPDGTVLVWPGACVVIDRAPENLYQSYAARHLAQELVPIAATSGASRSDMIVVRIENPYYPGSPWPDPGTDPVARQDYDYVNVRVISGVDSDATTVRDLDLGYSAIPLARIDLPPATSTILAEHITDLRRLTSLQRDEQGKIISPENPETLTASAFTVWPTEAEMDVYVPEWATHVDMQVILAGIKYGDAGDNGGSGWNVVGNLRLVLAEGTASQTNADQTTYNVEVDTGHDRATLLTGEGDVPVPQALRGTATTLKIQGKKNLGSAQLLSNHNSTISISATFKARPESNL